MSEVSVPTPEMESALTKAKIALMSSKKELVFFTTVLFSLKFKWDTTCNTAWTDGYSLGFNPHWFMSLTPDERVFVLVHESQHVAYLHNARLGKRDKPEFNNAADYVINGQLIDRGFTMPKIGLYDPTYDGLSTEEVYDILIQKKKQGQPSPDNEMVDLKEPPSQGDKGEGSGSEGDQEAAEQALARHVQDILVRAKTQSEMAGESAGAIPGEISLFLDKLLNPKLPWQTILRKYINGFTKNDYTWRKPNRRFFPEYHLPSMFSESLTELKVAVDISGSVQDEEFKQFVSEIASIFKTVRPKKITVIQFDTEIKSIDEVSSISELMRIKFTGRGGTQIQPVLDLVSKDPKQLMLVFTDGEFYIPQFHGKHNLVWMIHNNPSFKIPYGRIIHYEMKI